MYMEYTGLASNGGARPIDEGELYDLGATLPARQLCSSPTARDAVQGQLEAKLEELRDCAGIAGRDPQPAEGSYCE